MNRDEQIQRIVQKYLCDLRAGEQISHDNIVKRHPDLGSELREALRSAQGGATRTAPVDQTRTVAAVKPGSPEPASPAIQGYEILGILSRGGQGVVYRAFQISTQREVAIKVLLAGTRAEPETLTRFAREIETVARLQHPHIVTVFDSGTTPSGLRYCVMDLVRGVALTRHVRQTRITAEPVLELFAAICDAVDYAHGQGVVHRDLKPSNVLVDDSGQPRVLDFGLAKLTGDPELTQLSQSGQIMGTLAYMSPEQARGRISEIDARSDVYSLGVMLYECLTGALPYPLEPNLADFVRHIENTPPLPLSQVWNRSDGVPAAPKSGSMTRCPIQSDVETIVLKALSKPRERRYASAHAMGQDIRRQLAGQPIEAKRDSVMYVLQRRAEKAARRNRLAAYAVVAACAFVVAYGAGRPFFGRVVSVDRWWFRAIVSATGQPKGGGLDEVRMIAMTDSTDIEAIATDEQLTGITRDAPKSARRLFGRLMQRLAPASPRAVAYNLAFRGSTKYDDDFVRGVLALQAVGCDVVGVVPDWELDSDGWPDMSPAIARCTRWGPTTGNFPESGLWEFDVCLMRRGVQPRLGFVLAGAGAWRQPGHELSIRLHEQTHRVSIGYWRHKDVARRAKVWVEQTDTIVVSSAGHTDATAARSVYQPGDVIARLAYEIPPATMLRRATIALESVFAATPSELRDRFAGKVVLIGDGRKQALHPRPYNGRRVHSMEAAASAIEAVIRQLRLSPPIMRITVPAILALSAVVGIVGGVIARCSTARRLFVHAAVIVGILVTSAVCGHWLAILWSPAAPVLSAIIAIEGAAWISNVSAIKA